jgi:penicillin-binding protein 2
MHRVRIFSLILIFCLVVTLSGLAYIQLVMHQRYSTMSEGNRLKLVPLMAPRGTISDRNGTDLVKDVLSFNVSVIYSRIKNKEALAKDLGRTLGIPEDEILADIKAARSHSYTPYCVAEDVGIERSIHIEEIGSEHPGLLLEVKAKREYLRGSAASNLVGYLGLINRSEFEKLKPYGYRMDDLIGRSGVEKHYDDYLRGKHGGKQVEVDHRGREVTTLSLKEPVPGKSLRLTIDLRLQEFCDGLLKDKRGAIVAMDPHTGAILAMSSAPCYDPNIFVDKRRRGEVIAILKDEKYPLINRAISGVYPPGSVFKIIVAVAALETRTITANTMFSCGGSFVLGRKVFNCWKESGHGEQDLREAIKNSCNVYFWRMGLLLGVDKIAEYAARFGIGERTGIDLPAEAAGVLPSQAWKKKNIKDKWYKGETLNYSVGQGYLLVTPLQIARAVSVFANKGYLVKPYVVETVEGLPMARGEKMSLGISSGNMAAVREGMKMVVNDKRGTGLKARQKDVVVAGKTGTAQTSREKSHGWFGGFAPFDDAKLTVVVFDEYGGKGGYYAAETAGKVFEKARELGLI